MCIKMCWWRAKYYRKENKRIGLHLTFPIISVLIFVHWKKLCTKWLCKQPHLHCPAKCTHLDKKIYEREKNASIGSNMMPFSQSNFLKCLWSKLVIKLIKNRHHLFKLSLANNKVLRIMHVKSPSILKYKHIF